MPQVHFSPGPFPEHYKDGHPPEKETEEERRRYRCGLATKSENFVNTITFEEAFQQWLKQRCKDCNKTNNTSSEIDVIAQLNMEQRVEMHLDKKLLDLSSFATKTMVVDIPPLEVETQNESSGFMSAEEEMRHEGEIQAAAAATSQESKCCKTSVDIRVVIDSAHSVPDLVEYDFCGYQLWLPIVVLLLYVFNK
eukprot:g1779.t1